MGCTKHDFSFTKLIVTGKRDTDIFVCCEEPFSKHNDCFTVATTNNLIKSSNNDHKENKALHTFTSM